VIIGASDSYECCTSHERQEENLTRAVDRFEGRTDIVNRNDAYKHIGYKLNQAVEQGTIPLVVPIATISLFPQSKVQQLVSMSSILRIGSGSLTDTF